MAIISQAIKALKAKRLEITRVAAGAITKFAPVRLDVSNEAWTAGVSSEIEATVIGVALNDAAIGEDVLILLFGNLEDVTFTHALSILLFQSSVGPISENATTIVGEWFCIIGKSNGTGAIFINPEAPVEVT